jgi:hypothetical protein
MVELRYGPAGMDEATPQWNASPYAEDRAAAFVLRGVEPRQSCQKEVVRVDSRMTTTIATALDRHAQHGPGNMHW